MNSMIFLISLAEHIIGGAPYLLDQDACPEIIRRNDTQPCCGENIPPDIEVNQYFRPCQAGRRPDACVMIKRNREPI